MPTPCANPLLLEWIKEIYDLAKERNSKGVTTYKRAYESMKACPLTFQHPSEAQQLDGVGPKICDRLTERLKEHCEANGLPTPKKPRGTARKRAVAEELAAGAEVEESVPAKKPRKAKPYVPTLRSGPYAIILALSSLPEDSLRSLTKNELVELAQPHSDSSFTVPSEAGKFYTAWNSMKGLLDKDLVQERGRPLRKYALTDEGWEVARRIRLVEPGKTEGSPGPKKRRKAPEESGISEEGRNADENGASRNTARAAQHSGGFIDLEDDPSPERVTTPPVPAARKVNNQEKKSGRTIQSVGTAPVYKYGTFSRSTKAASKESLSKSKSPPTHLENPMPAAKQNFIELLSSSPEPEAAPDMPWASSSFIQDSRNLTSTPDVKASAKAPAPSVCESSLPPDNPSKSTAQSKTSTNTDSDLPNFKPINIPPSTFTVHLVLDNREVRTKNDRDYIASELTKAGSPPLVRPLPLGDFFWIAKLHSPTFLSTHHESGDEVALDYIVERKRLDDLVGSMTDGRFSEQKFRLRKSGVKNVIYLIEEFSLSTEKSTKFHEAIQSSIASTQVVNGYFVKQTRKLDETIRYLARMTRFLKSIYESNPLHLVPTSALTPSTYLPLLTQLRTSPEHKEKTYTITYPSFASLASKSDTLTLRDVYLKMLMCTRGISGEKALAIQKVWTTPKAFVDALQEYESEKDKETLIDRRLGGLVGRGSVKGILGAKVAVVWGKR